jgi:hypothetical protein
MNKTKTDIESQLESNIVAKTSSSFEESMLSMCNEEMRKLSGTIELMINKIFESNCLCLTKNSRSGTETILVFIVCDTIKIKITLNSLRSINRLLLTNSRNGRNAEHELGVKIEVNRDRKSDSKLFIPIIIELMNWAKLFEYDVMYLVDAGRSTGRIPLFEPRITSLLTI